MSSRNLPIPKGSKRACLCRDGSYSRKCCDKDYFSQGIGSITSTHPTPYQGYRLERCSDLHQNNAHYHGTLTIGAVYYMELENGHNSCYKVLEERTSEGIHINSIVLYNDCSECIAAN
jgi:hypothetical protein